MTEHHLPHVERTWTIGTVLASTGSLITTLAVIVGLIWSYADGVFTAPPVPQVEPPAPVTNMSRLDFLKRFTPAERIAVRASVDPVVLDANDMLYLAEFIDVADAYTVQYVNYLASAGIIAAERAASILAAVAP